jgi:RimJ/RimL family protein N-acetyltransferase
MRLTHPYPPLTDGVVWLRAPREDDAEAVCAACQDPEIKRWIPVPDPYSLADAKAFISQSLAATRQGLTLNTFAFDRGGTLLGSFGVPQLDRKTRTAEIGYWVAAEARGRGVAVRATRLLAAWLAGEQGFRTIELVIHRDNPQSRRVAEKSGFKDTGELRSLPRPRPGEESQERSFIVYAWNV